MRIREAKSGVVTNLLRSAENLLVNDGFKILSQFFRRSGVPSIVRKEIVNLLLGMVIKHLNKNAATIVNQFRQLQNIQAGMTVGITVDLPPTFLTSLPRLNMQSLGRSVVKLFGTQTSANVNVKPNYHL